MIHQHIWASPKPGMTEEEFQRYWLDVHAVKYASKIKQIRKYKIDTRIPWAGERNPAGWSGVAEIWLNDEKEQIESLQSKEFLDGARLDEPKWAAFWNTQVLDTDPHEILAGPAPTRDDTVVKVLVLLKRKPGLSVEDFRSYAIEKHANLNRALPGIRRILYGTTRDSWYTIGEPRFDMVIHLCFEDLATLDRAAASAEARACFEDDEKFCETKYTFLMAVREHWIIGPEAR